MPRSARRAQLLESALEVFVAQGYHAAAMDDIAERAGVSKPVLYQHFPGKLDLYLALLEQAADRIIGATRQALASTPDNKQRVAATMRVFYDYMSNAQGAFRLVFESDLTNDDGVRARVERVENSCAFAIADVIQEDTGLPRPEAELLGMALAGMAQVTARYWVQSGRSIPRDEAARLLAQISWRGISGFPKADGGKIEAGG